MSENTAFGPPWTALKILNWTTQFFEKKGIESARMDAEILLAEILSCSRVMIYANFDRPMSEEELADYKALIKRRAAQEPIAYITGTRGFWEFDFIVDPRVLIPRPDTERVIEVVLERSKEQTPTRILDIGTGSGAIAICLKSEYPDAEVVGSDISPEALEVAKLNVEKLGFDVDLIESDLFEKIPGNFDIVVSNPPYVANEERDIVGEDVIKFEPHIALFPTGENANRGLSLYEKIVPGAFERLKVGGLIVLEVGYRQGDSVKILCEKAGFEDIQLDKDYGGNERVVSARKKA